jgi:hypothetical protein
MLQYRTQSTDSVVVDLSLKTREASSREGSKSVIHRDSGFHWRHASLNGNSATVGNAGGLGGGAGGLQLTGRLAGVPGLLRNYWGLRTTACGADDD